jgi:hypothetical protein
MVKREVHVTEEACPPPRILLGLAPGVKVDGVGGQCGVPAAATTACTVSWRSSLARAQARTRHAPEGS